MIRFGNLVEFYRKGLGFITRMDFAKEIKVSYHTLFTTEHNIHLPKLKTLHRIIAVLQARGLKPEEEKRLYLSYGGFEKEPEDFQNLFRFIRLRKEFTVEELMKIVNRSQSDTIREIESKGIIPSLKAFSNLISGQWLKKEEREKLIKSYFMELYPGKDYNCLPRLLKEARVRENLNQGEAAERLGISRTSLGGLERGDSLPCLKIIRKIAVEFNLKEKEVLSLVKKEKKRRQRIRRERKRKEKKVERRRKEKKAERRKRKEKAWIFGDSIREKRRKRRWTRGELAQRGGVTLTTITT